MYIQGSPVEIEYLKLQKDHFFRVIISYAFNFGHRFVWSYGYNLT